MIVLAENIEPFYTEWGTWAVPFEWNGNPYCLPLGFEQELDARNIEYVINQVDEELELP